MKRRVRYTFVFLMLAFASAYWGRLLTADLEDAWLPIGAGLATYFTISISTLAMAYGFAIPLFFKRPSGTIDPVGWIIHLPYLSLNLLILRVIAVISNEDPANLINDSIYLGRRLTHREYKSIFQDGVAATVDLTAEFNEIKPLRCGSYLLIPTVDTFEPTLKQLKDAVNFIEQHRNRGPVYVHCAMGHGRSATVVAAWLIATKKLTVPEAIAFIKEKRPLIGLHAEQKQLLHTFADSLRD